MLQYQQLKEIEGFIERALMPRPRRRFGDALPPWYVFGLLVVLAAIAIVDALHLYIITTIPRPVHVIRSEDPDGPFQPAFTMSPESRSI